MRTNNPIEDLHSALAHAEYVGASDIDCHERDWELYRATGEDNRIPKTRRPVKGEIVVVAMFPQTWASTALGFGGIGGAAITDAYTIVLKSDFEYLVYFGGRFAYKVSEPNETFGQDLNKQKMASVDEFGKYTTL